MRARGLGRVGKQPLYRVFLQTQRWMPRNRSLLKTNHSEMHKENPFGLNRQIMFLTGLHSMSICCDWWEAAGEEERELQRAGRRQGCGLPETYVDPERLRQ